MTNQVIPAQAVEAARDAMQQFALIEDRDGLQSWDAYARIALEAAAPHMLAAAWEQGWEAREDLHAYDVWGGEGEEPNSSNPYKKVTK